MTQLKSVFHLPAVLLLCMFVFTGIALAQPPGGQAGGQASGQPGDQAGQMQGGAMGQQGGPGGTQMDQEQMQQMMAQRYQELLGMSDEEWSVIGSYVLKVATLSQSASTRSSGMRMMMGSRSSSSSSGSSRRQDSQAQGEDQSQARSTSQGQRTRSTSRASQDENLQALQTLLEDENATSDEIKAKLSTLRKAREKAKQELAVAQRELRELLTLRQEAVLVVQGLLE